MNSVFWILNFEFRISEGSEFQCVEIFAEDAGGFGDGDECGAVNLFDDAGDTDLVGAMGDNQEHVVLLAVVRAVAFQEGSAAVQFLVDAMGYLVILFGKDHKLVGLVEAVYHGIGHQHAHKKHHKTINQLRHIHENEERRANDKEVGHHIDLAVGDIAVFADHEGNDVESTGITAPVDGDTRAERTQRSADDDAHEHVIHNGLGEDTLSEIEKHGYDDGANQRVDAEFGAQDFPRDGDKYGIKHEGGDANGDFGGEKEDGCNTGHAAARHLKRSHECGPSEHENRQTQGDEEVVFDFGEDLLAGYHNRRIYFI